MTTFARAPQGGQNGEPVDWPALKKQILENLDVVGEYTALGVQFTGSTVRSTGWRECRAYGREDKRPSAAVNVLTGVYKADGENAEVLGFFDFAARHGGHGSWIETLEHYADKAGIPLPFAPRYGDKGRIEAVYPYRTAEGEVAYEVVRYIRDDGTKTFRQRRPDGKGGHHNSIDGVTPVPYNLPEILAGGEDDCIFITEGEKDADRLTAELLTATTNHGGTGNTKVWEKLAPHFAGRDVTVLLDNDAAGVKHGHGVAAFLHPVVRSVRVIALPGLPIRGDVSTWLDAGNTIEELGQIAYSTPLWEPGSGFEGSEGSEGDPQVEIPWRVPRLRRPVPAVPFPLDALPASLAQLCREGSQAVQCPVDYFGAASLAFAGAAIGLSVNLKLKAHYYEAPNLYVAIVGPPGTKKTPALKILARPFYAIDRDLRDTFQQEMETYEEDRRNHEADKRKGNPGPVPIHPVQVELTLDDTTREAVASVHAKNPRGLILIKDELTSWVSSLDAYRAGKGDDKQFWLKVNSGALVKVNRKGAAADPILIPQPCVSIVGGLTPDTLPSIRGHGDDGWLDRILFAYPEPIEADDWTEYEISDEVISDWSDAIRKLWGRAMVRDEDGRSRPFHVGLSDQAKQEWKEWINLHRLETRHQDFPRYLLGPWSKIEGFAARLALILSLVHQAYDPTDLGPPRDIEALNVWAARRLAEYFKAHFRRARAELIRQGSSIVPDDPSAILKWLRYSERLSFSERDARLNFQGRFGTNSLALADALDWLIRHDCIRSAPVERKPTGRPPSPVYQVNPTLFGEEPSEPDSTYDMPSEPSEPSKPRRDVPF